MIYCYAKTEIGSNQFSGYNTDTIYNNYQKQPQTATNSQEPTHQGKPKKLEIKPTKYATNQP
jgi:hypothetical protein